MRRRVVATLGPLGAIDATSGDDIGRADEWPWAYIDGSNGPPEHGMPGFASRGRGAPDHRSEAPLQLVQEVAVGAHAKVDEDRAVRHGRILAPRDVGGGREDVV